MNDRRPCSSCLAFGSGGRGERAAWLPLLFIGSMMFWTVALGLGGWSFMFVNRVEMDPVGPSATATDTMPGNETGGMGGSERIAVQMEESQEPEDVDDNTGAATPAVFPPGD